MRRAPLALALILVTALLIANPGRAAASFRGTPGKVASISIDLNLQIWDPVDGSFNTITKTVEPRTDGTLYGTNGRPVWSPDGTKVAFVKEVPDPGDFELHGTRIDTHTAIFTYDVETGALKQVSEPPAGRKTEIVGDQSFGHVVADFAPSWSGNGTIGFTRLIDATGGDDDLWPERGSNLYTTPAGGGGATRITNYLDPLQGLVNSSVGIPEKGGFITLVSSIPEGASEPLSSLIREGGSGRGGVLASRSGFATISDFDVSPDGTKLAYTVGNIGATFSSQAFLVPLDSADPEHSLGSWPGTFLRFSNTGSGLLRFACSDHGPQQCGMGEHPLDDPTADIRPGEPDRIVNTSPDVGPVGAGGAQTSVDVQPQVLPVIYIPGFLGSEISCGPSRIWPLGLNFPRIALDATGTGTPRCPSAGPSGKVVDSVAGSDVYKSASTFMSSRFGDRGTMFAWDWRKAPKETLTLLDKAVDAAIQRSDISRRQGVRRVAIVAHSYGGLLTRAYLEVHPEKVARVLTLGTPYWGSPKAIFPLALGIETPVSGLGLDMFVDNDDMQLFARNLAGNYQLYPSRSFGPWLSLGGVVQSQNGVSGYVIRQNGNPALLAAAQGEHNRIYDGFFDNSSLIDYRAVSGTGLATMGKVDLSTSSGGDLVNVNVSWINGDGTVPAKSAGQGPTGVFPPKGDPVHVQHSCNVDHVALGGSAAVLNPYAEFLDVGEVPPKISGPCLFSATVATFTGLTPPKIAVHAAARAGAAARSLSPFAAARAGLAQVIALKRRRVIVETDQQDHVTLSVRAKGTVKLTPITERGKGKTRLYKLNGKTVRIAPPAKAGAAPVVRRGGKRLKPLQ
jgi:pimeloyl-ACP methyl ester carboxylesterase